MPEDVTRVITSVETQAPKTPSTGPVDVEVSVLEGVREKAKVEQPLTSMQSALAFPLPLNCLILVRET